MILLVPRRRRSFGPFYAVLLVYALCYMPTLALSNSMSFRQMKDPAREFPAIRVLGTIGWIVAGLFIGTLGLEATAMPMRIAAAGSIVLGLFCLVLPHTPPQRTRRATLSDVLGLDALKLLRERSFAVFVLGSFLVCIPLQFYYAFANPFLNELGREQRGGQDDAGPDVGDRLHAGDAVVLQALGVKYMLLVGMAAWTASYVLFAMAMPARRCGCCTPASCSTASATTSSSSPARSTSIAARRRTAGRGAGTDSVRHARCRHVHRVVGVRAESSMRSA